MACWISYQGTDLPLNNAQFSSLIELVLDVGRRNATGAAELGFVDRMVRLNEEEFWPGRGIQIESDFPDLDERKFWARTFLDTARAIFDRSVGEHQHSFWQAQRIHQAYGVGRLFVDAVRATDGKWFPDTLDYREFDRVVNRR